MDFRSKDAHVKIRNSEWIGGDDAMTNKYKSTKMTSSHCMAGGADDVDDFDDDFIYCLPFCGRTYITRDIHSAFVPRIEQGTLILRDHSSCHCGRVPQWMKINLRSNMTGSDFLWAKGIAFRIQTESMRSTVLFARTQKWRTTRIMRKKKENRFKCRRSVWLASLSMLALFIWPRRDASKINDAVMGCV